MNRQQLWELIFNSKNLTDAAAKIGRNATWLRHQLKTCGLKHYAKILNSGQGADTDKYRRIDDGFDTLTEWEQYSYRMACDKNRITPGATGRKELK